MSALHRAIKVRRLERLPLDGELAQAVRTLRGSGVLELGRQPLDALVALALHTAPPMGIECELAQALLLTAAEHLAVAA